MSRETRWRGSLAILILALVCIASFSFAAHQYMERIRVNEQLSAQLKELNRTTGGDISSLKDRLAIDEKTNTDLQGDLKVVTDKLKITQSQLKKARTEAAQLNTETTQKLTALDTSVHSELATKATNDDVKTVDTNVTTVSNNLDKTISDLDLARSELGTLIARNSADIKSLQLKLSPSFPWPPPRWTTRTKLPDGLVASENKQEKISVVLARLQQALQNAQISEWSLFPVDGDDHGFAIVCAMEAFDEYGNSLPYPQRYSPEPILPQKWGIWYYLRALFTAPPGRYRVIVLAITSQADLPPTQVATSQELVSFVKTGATNLPRDVVERLTNPGTRCEAIIYEFRKRGVKDDPIFVPHETVDPAHQLAGAKLWTLAQL